MFKIDVKNMTKKGIKWYQALLTCPLFLTDISVILSLLLGFQRDVLQ